MENKFDVVTSKCNKKWEKSCTCSINYLDLKSNVGLMTINETGRSETLCQHDPYSYVQYIIIIYIGSPIALIGIFCNSLLVALFTDQPNRSTPTLYFLVLAYLDIGICLLYLALFSVDAYAIYHEIYWMWRMWISYVMPCLVCSKVIQLCSTYIVVAATIERCWITFHSNAERKALKRRVKC
uniref:G-protein coupled receptors family 1 profile domain-containing protein n=1 Tax=Romanomermis culicivorax TaxID=13658 RepID=A0A915I6N6_ROMCU